MANPYIHSKSSAKRYGGKPEDYMEIHKLLDLPKVCMNNHTNRFLTHNTFFAYEIIPKVFGYNIINSDGKSVDTVDVALYHILEDFRMQFIPTPQDFLKHMEVQKWMQNGVKLIDNPEAIELAKKIKENGRINQEMERV